ncbi:MAG: hypothetical protein HY072_08920, partial [Deltaproteobacteria bacterium]|nr:hypothetical protein [Deltaproteobacteria bacterium]
MDKNVLIKILIIVIVFYSTTIEIYPAADTSGTVYNAFPELDINSMLPPRFQSSGTSQLNGIFISCKNPGAPMAADALSLLQGGDFNFSGGLIGVETSCPATGGSSVKSSEDLSCKQFKGDGGVFNQKKVNEMIKKNNEAIAGLTCKKMKTEALQGELKCLSQQANIYTQQIASLQNEYVKNIQGFQSMATQLKGIEDGRKVQAMEVEERIVGNKDVRLVGLDDMKRVLEGLVGIDAGGGDKGKGPTSISAQVAQIRNMYRSFQYQQKAFQEEIKTHTAALMGQCFKTRKDAQLKCDPKGGSETAYNYILCRYKQTKGADSSKIRRSTPDATKLKIAETQTAALQSILDEILSQIPDNVTPPTVTDPSNPAAFATALQGVLNRPLGILDIEELKRKYLPQIMKVLQDQKSANNTNDVAFGKQIIDSFEFCFNRAENTVKKSVGMANTFFGGTILKLKDLALNISTLADQYLLEYSKYYVDSMRALTGQHVPLDVSGCMGAAAEVQVSCMENVKTNFIGLLHGTTPQATMKIYISGNQVPPIPVMCFGINGCLSTMQNLDRKLGTEINKVAGYRKNYIKQSNDTIDRFTNQVAQMMNGPSQFLTDRMKQLNSALQSLGVKSGITIKGVPSETLEQTEETFTDIRTKKEIEEKGIYKIPKNVVNLIGSRTKPPLLDIS